MERIEITLTENQMDAIKNKEDINMKQVRFVISDDTFGRNYLAIRAWNYTFDDPVGVFWTSFVNWEILQKEIAKHSDFGRITAFKTKEEAESVCREFDIEDYTIREILMEV